MKSKNFQKSQNKAKIGQKSQKKCQKFGFLSNFGFLVKFWLFWKKIKKLFWNFLDFLEPVCCLSFWRLHKDYIDREYMTQSDGVRVHIMYPTKHIV
jgi:hypothetical protein